MSKAAAVALLALALPAGAAAPRVAVVIDDFGLNYKRTPPDEEWMALPSTMTFAVMPESPRTRKAAALTAAASAKELIIHFPFDPFQLLSLPLDATDPEDVAKVRELLAKALKQVPGAKGANNHRSYRATQNRPMMRAFMAAFKPTGLYFIDSKVAEKSVAGAEARAAGVPTASNFVFLDTADLHTREFCAKGLRQAVAHARKRGSAVAIGHHYFRSTLDCLREEIPRHEAEGVEFVTGSALVR